MPAIRRADEETVTEEPPTSRKGGHSEKKALNGERPFYEFATNY